MRSHPVKPLRLLPALALLGAMTACAPVPPMPAAYEAAPMFERRIISAVNFDFDSYRIRPESFGLLDNAALALNDPQLGGLRFEINGNTDISGRLAYNIALSMLRATAVADYLAARGVPRERMRPKASARCNPTTPTICAVRSTAGWRSSRCAEGRSRVFTRALYFAP